MSAGAGQWLCALRLAAVHRDASHDGNRPVLFHYLTLEVEKSSINTDMTSSMLVDESYWTGGVNADAENYPVTATSILDIC